MRICRIIKKHRSIEWSFLLFYVFILLYFTIIRREPTENVNIQKILFWGYNSPSAEILLDNFVNIIIFLPIGVVSAMLFKRRSLLLSLLLGLFLSETIECFQLIYSCGTFDVDDLFNNTLGAFVGALLYLASLCIYIKIWHRNNNL